MKRQNTAARETESKKQRIARGQLEERGWQGEGGEREGEETAGRISSRDRDRVGGRAAEVMYVSAQE